MSFSLAKVRNLDLSYNGLDELGKLCYICTMIQEKASERHNEKQP